MNKIENENEENSSSTNNSLNKVVNRKVGNFFLCFNEKKHARKRVFSFFFSKFAVINL